MVTALILGSILLSAPPDPLPNDLAQEDRLVYEEAKARAGRDADANVSLALWCEAHGFGARRLEHLWCAVEGDPSHAAARALLGMVSYRGQWKHPEEVASDARSDEALQARLAAYNIRREAMPDATDAHWALGVWREQNGLTPEAIAHFTAVTRLDPNRAMPGRDGAAASSTAAGSPRRRSRPNGRRPTPGGGPRRTGALV